MFSNRIQQYSIVNTQQTQENISLVIINKKHHREVCKLKNGKYGNIITI